MRSIPRVAAVLVIVALVPSCRMGSSGPNDETSRVQASRSIGERGNDETSTADLDLTGSEPGAHAAVTQIACAGGCSVGDHPIEPLSETEFRQRLADLAGEKAEARSTALDHLLFHGARARELLSRIGTGTLDADRVAALRRELERTHVRVSVRVVDESGTLRANLDGARFPLGKKQHVHIEDTHALQPPEVSGTVHRTGLEHFWTRL